MIPVEEALSRILESLNPVAAESLAISQAAGRVLAEPVAARRTQPPVAVSAMDGWAVRAEDVAQVPARLRPIGESAAGRGFGGCVGTGEAVRIFTGAPAPDGADCIVLQEDADLEGQGETARVLVREGAASGTYIRPAGLDFRTGEILLHPGRRLSPADIALAAAMDHPWLAVRRRPRIALLSTGDELVRPGEPVGESQIVSSNALGLAALIRAEGGEAIDLGIAGDTPASLRAHAEGARGADLLVTLGGASAGEHDLVRKVLADGGAALDFWRIAMRPGKPLMFGRAGGVPLLGLPGNPVSSMVCGLVFLRPAIRRLLGLDTAAAEATGQASLGRALPANDRRQDYLRAELLERNGELVATPFKRQDSSILSLLSAARCLVIRKPHAPAAAAGERVEILRL